MFIEEIERRKRKEIFLQKAILKYGNKFNYSKVEYFNSITLVIIICSKHKIEFDENITKGQAYDLIKDLKKHIEAQRALPATEKQLELMEKRHLPVTENMTRGEASDAIRQDNYKKFVITENQKKALEKCF